MIRDRKIYCLAYWTACFILAGTFLSAGYYKARDSAGFARIVADYGLLPDAAAGIVSFMIQWLEIICGIVLLAVPGFRAAALRTVILLLAVFSGAITFNLLRGVRIGCGCFGSGEAPADWMHAAGNLVLMALAGLALYGRKKAAV